MKKKYAAIGLLILFFAFFLWGRIADAAEARIGLGFGYASNEGARYQEVMILDSERKWYAAVTRIGNDYRHNYHYWRTTGGYRVNWRKDTNVSPFLRFGVAYFDDPPDDYIDEHLAFDLAVGIRFWDIVELELDQHNSTAGRSNNNEGLDAIMLGLTFQF